MAVKYLASKRITGTNAERISLNFDPVPQTSWKELGRTTLSSEADDITVSSLPDKDNLMLLYYINQSGAAGATIRLNEDDGSNYAWRNQRDGTDDTTGSSQTFINLEHSGNTTNDFGYGYMSSISGQEALTQTHSVYQGTAGYGNTPNRQETVGKWADTSTITSLTIHNADTGSYASGSEVVVLGCDNDEADSGTNFWQELSSTELTATHSGALTIPQFTTKKYLMIKYYINASTDCYWRVGTGGTIDDGSSYGNRYNSNGGGDTVLNYTSFLQHNPIIEGEVFIMNKSDQEKLTIQHETGRGTAGVGNAPNRREDVGKWVNTSGQIDTLQYFKSGVSFYAGTNIKVYGSD